jgi:uncharacterized protein DUF3105
MAIVGRHLGCASVAGTLVALVVLACGDASSDGSAVQGDGGGAARLAEPLHPAASCFVEIATPPFLETKHVPEGTPIAWNSNPPCSGPHYPVWANFQEFNTPIDRGYLVHDMEHGAIVLLYKCEGAACAPIQDALRKVRDAVPTDPSCDPKTRARVVIAPDPQLDVPVAAAAWGWTYKAQCADIPTLEAFAREHYGQGPEDICAPGRAF